MATNRKAVDDLQGKLDTANIKLERVTKASQFAKALDGDIMFDGSSIEGFVRIEESDMLLVPDLSTFKIFPGGDEQGRVARLICDIQTPEGAPFDGDPRGALKRQVARAAGFHGAEWDQGGRLAADLNVQLDTGEREGQPLDATKHFIVIPDIIGFGQSSKPSDGLRARFPHYRLRDVVIAQHKLLTEHLGIAHLKLIMGISLGGMLTWMFGEMFPDFMDALVPIASQPGPMSGRNWIQRKINLEAIRNDPEWNNGDYEKQPTWWVRVAPLSGLMTQSVVRIQDMAPTREKGDALYQQLVERAKKGDANNRLYQIESTIDYDPSADLEKIKARLFAINFADDAINPPELGVLEAGVARVPGARCVTIPTGPQTYGHYTTMRAAVWRPHLAEFLAGLPKR